MYGWIDLSYLYCGANAGVGVGVDVACSLLFSIKIIVCHVPDAGKQKPKKLVFTVRSRSHINIILIISAISLNLLFKEQHYTLASGKTHG